MKKEQHGHVNGGPRGVKKSKNAIASQKLTNLDQIAKCPGGTGTGLAQVCLEARVENLGAESVVQAHTCAHQDTRAHPFGKRHHGKQEQGQ